MNNDIDMFQDWIPPAIPETEFRLYYKDDGSVSFYTCEKPEGNHIIIDSETYAECRNDIKVLDGKIVKPEVTKMITKLKPSKKGKKCAKQDVSVIVGEDYEGDAAYWEIKNREYGKNN